MGETVRSLGGGWGQYEEDGIESMESESVLLSRSWHTELVELVELLGS